MAHKFKIVFPLYKIFFIMSEMQGVLVDSYKAFYLLVIMTYQWQSVINN